MKLARHTYEGDHGADCTLAVRVDGADNGYDELTHDHASGAVKNQGPSTKSLNGPKRERSRTDIY